MNGYARNDVGTSAGSMGHQMQGGDMATNSLNGTGPVVESKERFARENHSEIERRRRNKMTHYINELAEMVPQCSALGRKPDKLTILRMAVSHMKGIRGTTNAGNDPMNFKPSFLTDQELKHLILEAANGFLFVICCETGTVLYVSDSVIPILNLRQEDWVNNTIYNLIHPDDIFKVRDQLCNSEASLQRVLDLKSGSVKKEQNSVRVHMSCRRGFICRMRLGNVENISRIRNRRPIFTQNNNHYAVVHVTGYVKTTAPAGMETRSGGCLIGIGRLQLGSMPLCPEINPPSQFTLRLNEEGKITFADQRSCIILCAQAPELVGKFWWQLVHATDEQLLKDYIRLVMSTPGAGAIKCKFIVNGILLSISIQANQFRNPYSEQFEYIIATHHIVEENIQLPNTSQAWTLPQSAALNPSVDIAWADQGSSQNVWNNQQQSMDGSNVQYNNHQWVPSDPKTF
uniref:Aryl hydrocarbon receptor nuclear translocator n=1 Tax=Rhabditophanes sp. KR3021 TaxID=114890 RepID=A0AC35U510_9BILA